MEENYHYHDIKKLKIGQKVLVLACGTAEFSHFGKTGIIRGFHVESGDVYVTLSNGENCVAIKVKPVVIN